MRTLKAALASLIMWHLCACPASDTPRPDVGLSEAGPGLDVAQQIPDLGTPPPRDVSVPVDVARVSDAGTQTDAASSSDASHTADSGLVAPDVALVDTGADVTEAGPGVADASPGVDDAGPGVNDGGQLVDAGVVQGDAGAMNHAQITGTVFDVETRRAAQGVHVCVRGQEQQYPCVVSDNGGQYSLRVPHNVNFVLLYDRGTQAIQPTLVHLRVPLGHTTWNVASLRATRVPALMFVLGQQNDVTKGHVSFTVGLAGNVGLPGVTATIAPQNGAGPFYLGAGGQPDPAARATSTNGTGVFVNVDPGTFDVSVQPPQTHRCAPFANAVRQGNAWRVPTVAGHLSVVVFECTAN